MDSTSASTYHGPEVTFESVMRAAAEVSRFVPIPTASIRLHPDDMRELRLRGGDRLTYHGGQIIVTSIFGVPVVEDPSAPRLPRKAG